MIKTFDSNLNKTLPLFYIFGLLKTTMTGNILVHINNASTFIQLHIYINRQKSARFKTTNYKRALNNHNQFPTNEQWG